MVDLEVVDLDELQTVVGGQLLPYISYGTVNRPVQNAPIQDAVPNTIHNGVDGAFNVGKGILNTGSWLVNGIGSVFGY
jgi:hypothetical protein